MIKTVYKKSFAVLMKKPFKLWGISLLNILLCAVAGVAFGMIPAISILIGILLNTAMTMIFLRGYCGEEVECVDLFACFKDWATIKRVLGGMLWMWLWIFIWSLIPIAGPVFAIIRMYEYRFTPYIIMTEPDVKPTEAIKLSKQRTEGWKGKMFGADILMYVIAWAAMIILGLLAAIPYVGVLFGIIEAVVVIAVSVLMPLFAGLVKAACYEEVKYAAAHPRAAYMPPQANAFCPNCGSPVSENSTFCPNCGARL